MRFSHHTLIKLLKQAIERRHLLMWVSVWGVIMVMSWGAIALLLNPNLGKRPTFYTILPTPISTDPPVNPNDPASSALLRSGQRPNLPPNHYPNNPKLALWSFGVVATICLYGSMMLTQQIRSPNLKPNFKSPNRRG